MTKTDCPSLLCFFIHCTFPLPQECPGLGDRGSSSSCRREALPEMQALWEWERHIVLSGQLLFCSTLSLLVVASSLLYKEIRPEVKGCLLSMPVLPSLWCSVPSLSFFGNNTVHKHLVHPNPTRMYLDSMLSILLLSYMELSFSYSSTFLPISPIVQCIQPRIQTAKQEAEKGVVSKCISRSWYFSDKSEGTVCR